jgi:hypothetical protein
VPLARQAGGAGNGAEAAALPEIYHGTIVDHDCDRQGLSILRQRDCQDRTHLNALKLANGTYLHFNLYQSRYTRFVTDPAARGREVSIEGTVYPDIQTLALEQPIDAVFDAAQKAASGQGWEIVAANRDTGSIEATATTFWFRFKDDVVIRLTPSGAGTSVDIRSKSRVGRGDMGANAARIRLFLQAMEDSAAS